MSVPPLVPVTGTTNEGWGRKVANLLNRVTTSTMNRGTTSERPNNAGVGDRYYDTSLNRPLWFDGTIWRDAMGGPA